MGMMLHRHSGVANTATPDIVIKENKTEKTEFEQTVEKKDSYVNDPVHRGRKRNN